VTAAVRAALIGLALVAAGCGGGRFPMRTIQVGELGMRVEIADDGAKRAQGLMNRDTLPADEGMLFVYPDEAPRSFWMKNTRIPLSIAYIDRQGRIVSVHDMRPLSTRGTPSDGPAMYALEVNQGWFAQHQIGPGTVVGGLPGPSKD
jgi:uncharacterized membrane protein (UPF0127 family)